MISHPMNINQPWQWMAMGNPHLKNGGLVGKSWDLD